MKKFSILFSILAIFLSVQSFAIPRDPCDKKVICYDEASPGPFAFSYPKDIGLACPRDFYTFGEFLLMKASEDGLDYAITDSTPTNILPLVGNKLGLSSKSKEWDWRPGFRIGFGTFFTQDGWSVDGTWTYVRVKAEARDDAEAGTILLPIFIQIAGSAPYIQTVSARWSGDFNTFDLMVGKPYHVSRYFVSHPSFGLRAAWIDQDYHVRYFDTIFTKLNAFYKNDYRGVGIRGCYKGEFHLGSSWMVFGKVAGSLLFSKFDIDNHTEPLLAALYGYSIKDTFYSINTNAEIHCGFQWSKFFNKGKYLLSIKAAYEFQHFWEQNQIKFALNSFFTNAVAIPATKGDLSLNGVSLGFYLDF